MEVVRWLLLTFTSLMIGMTLVVAVRYMIAWRQERTPRRAFLPFHVWTVTVSYNLLLFLAAKVQLERMSWGWTWMLGVYSVAVTLGIIAMWVISRLTYDKEQQPDKKL